MKKLILSALLLGSIVVLTTSLLSDQTRSINANKFSFSQQKKLEKISMMIWDKKPEKQILKAWKTFIDQEKRRKPDFKEAIKIIFEEVKTIAQKNIQIAQETIRQAQILKIEVDREKEKIRNLRLQYKRSKRFTPIKRMKLEFSEANPPKAIITEAGYISDTEELGHYAGDIQWAGKEASLQGTGGVALLEFAKDAIQTAVSNISGTGTQSIQMRKIVCRKIGAM